MRSVFFPSSPRHQPEVIRKDVSIEREQSCVYGIFFWYQNHPNNPSVTLLYHSCTILVLHERWPFMRIKQQGISFKNRFILKDFFKKNLCIQFLLSHNAYYVCLVQCCHLLLISLFTYSGLCNTHSTVTTENTLCVNQQIAFERFEKLDNIITGIYPIFKGAQNDKINILEIWRIYIAWFLPTLTSSSL